jgi:DNA polymerase-3 subunit gamma/tau
VQETEAPEEEAAPLQEAEAPAEAAPMDEQSDIENSGGDIITGIDEDDYYDQQAMGYVEPDYDQQASDDENAFEEKDTEDD